MEQQQPGGAQKGAELDKEQEIASQRQSSNGNAGNLPAEDSPTDGTGDEFSEEGRS